MQDRHRLPRIDFVARSGYSCCKGLDRISSHSVGVNEVLMDLLTWVRAKTRPEEEQQHVILDGMTL